MDLMKTFEEWYEEEGRSLPFKVDTLNEVEIRKHYMRIGWDAKEADTKKILIQFRDEMRGLLYGEAKRV